jgi:hypothetical protein|nr:MAG TPA: hypothetical protein [Caudoviricetes sp.]
MSQEEKIKETLISKQVTRIEQKDDFTVEVTLDDGVILTLTGNEGGCCCGNGDWTISEILSDSEKPSGRIMNAWVDDQIRSDEEMDEICGPIRVFIMVEGREYPLVEFNGYDNGWYGHGFHANVTRITSPDHTCTITL